MKQLLRKLKLFRIIEIVLLIFIVSIFFKFFVLATSREDSKFEEKRSRKIVVFDNSVSEEKVNIILTRIKGERIKKLKILNAQVVNLSEEEQKSLLSQKGVIRIEDDVEVNALPVVTRRIRPSPTPTPTPFQTLPWGIDRVNAEKVWATTSGDLVKIGIVDTGIDINHPDLKENIKGGISTVNYTSSYNDDNGHGTHVAGIVAAVNNNFGVVGVSPKAYLYAVKVLNKKGSGYLSDIIEGLEWIIANKIQVINMSLGTTTDVQSFHEAIQKTVQNNIVVVAAAGNDGGAVNFPAAYPEVIAVSATDENNNLALWSSRGPEIDLASPGVNIYSTYYKSQYITLSGTSMAAPHVTGVTALVLSVPGRCDYNSDGICTPAEVQQILEQTAVDLGTSGKDNYYGSGLVNAERAVIGF